MILKYLGKQYQRAWESLTKNNPATGFMQSYFWAEFTNSIGWETYKIGVFDTNTLLAGAIIGKYSHYKDYNILYIPEGPVIPYETPQGEKMFQMLIGEIDNIADFYGIKKTSHLSIEPKIAIVPSYFPRFVKARSDRQPLKTILLDLGQSEETLLQSMKPKGRYNIKLAAKHGVEIFSLRPDDGLKYFLPLYHEFVRTRAMEAKDDDYFQNLAYVLSRDTRGTFYFARYRHEILAAALVVYYGNTATYLFGASKDSHKYTMAPYLLHWEIIKQAKRKGYVWYDWYGISPAGDDERHPWYGFTNFKKKFGGKIVTYIGGYDFVYNEGLYKRALSAK